MPKSKGIVMRNYIREFVERREQKRAENVLRQYEKELAFAVGEATVKVANEINTDPEFLMPVAGNLHTLNMMCAGVAVGTKQEYMLPVLRQNIAERMRESIKTQPVLVYAE